MRKILLLAIVCGVGPVLAGEPPSRYGSDAPELAHLGDHAVGVKTLHLVQHGQMDVLAFDAAKASAPLADRALTVDLWYPARPRRAAPRAVYTARFPSEPPAPPVSFSVPRFPQPLMRRPLDIAFVARTLQSMLGAEADARSAL
jgi:hypothetical protein